MDILVPSAGESVSEGTLLEWLVAVGDEVQAGQPIAEISTDKLDIELPAPAAGVLEEQLAQPGETVAVGQALGRLRPTSGKSAGPAPPVEPGPASPEAPASDAPTQETATIAAPAAQAPATASPLAAPPVAAEAPRASPVAERVARHQGVDLGAVSGSGRGGRIMKADVLAAASQPDVSEQPLRGAGAQLAQYMQQSLSVPTATSFRTLPVTQLAGRRGQLREAGQRVSFTHLLAYAIAQAARQMPQMTRHYETRGVQALAVDDGQLNLGIAVDVERPDGSRMLLVPVLRGADRLGFADLVAAFDDLVERARSGALSPADLADPNLTLTNPGGLGTQASVPRLMPGQGAIIAAGAIGYPPGLSAAGARLGVEQTMTLTSTYDHRIIQGAESGQFLALIDALLQGEQSFYEDLFAGLGLPLPAAPPVPAPQLADGVSAPDRSQLRAVFAATSLVRSYRTHGHLAAALDPLGAQPVGDPALDPSSVDLSEAVMAQIPADILDLGVEGQTLAEALPHLREVYCGSIAYEFEHITSHEQRSWLRDQIEHGRHLPELTSDQKRALLRRLLAVDAFEGFLQKAYMGQKQFSICGLDATVPMLDKAVELAANVGAQEVVIGMAHRGRLSVLAHTLGRSYRSIFGEFEGGKTTEVVREVTELPHQGTGDVKYHSGGLEWVHPDEASSRMAPDEGKAQPGCEHSIAVRLESNPSHLEFVDPVVLGAARAAQTEHSAGSPQRDPQASMPIMLHGDAAFPGQGVVAETLNLQNLEGYQVGGALHMVQNNQVGFTTDPQQSRSTHWASDLAKGYDMPIIHVNADHVEACVGAVRLAMAYRARFGQDVLIDLVGYRRFGHNEADEPAYTQPQMYQRIKAHPRICDLYAEQLLEDGTVSKAEVDSWRAELQADLSEQHQQLQAQVQEVQEDAADDPLGIFDLHYTPVDAVPTGVPAEELRRLNRQLTELPDGFQPHPKLAAQLQRRLEAVEQGGIDWAQAEALALGSLLEAGVPIRLTGQDSQRGTFSHRHLVLHAATGEAFMPLQHLSGAQSSIEVHNSPLSEAACLGFEYGYAQQQPDALVMWEAQFGDFANGAQVIIDQFIASGLSKWGESSRLTLLLPHGYEGAGPEHSSARLERFLQLCAEGNLRVANPSTPAQYFHLLRRQALEPQCRPLIVMTPKSLLRLSGAASELSDLASDRFHPVLADRRADPSQVERLVLCSGKIFYDLDGHQPPQVALGRIEQLYPFPEEEIAELLAQYPNLSEVLWAQEEPRNMGAREFVHARLQQMLPHGIDLGYIGRPERASPSEGYPAAHRAEQQRILEEALSPQTEISPFPEKSPGER